MSLPSPASQAVAAPTRVARFATLLPVCVVAVGFVATVVASRFVGPAFDEEARVSAVRRATALARQVTNLGPLTLFDDSARAIYREIANFGGAPAMLSGWLGEVLAKAGLLDRLVGARLGWLFFTGLAPGAVFFLVRKSRGDRAAALAAGLLLAVPRWAYEAPAARPPAVVVSLWLLILATYVHFLPVRPPAKRRFARLVRLVAFGVVVGIAAAADMAALWILLLVVVHFAFVRGWRVFAVLRRGRLPLPAGFLPALAVTPVLFVGLSPGLWAGGGSAVDWLLSPLSPSIDPVFFRGAIVSAKTVPLGYATQWLVATTPAWLLLLSVAGGVVVFLEARDARRGAGPKDVTRLGSLAALAVGAAILGPLLTPSVLVHFPPRAELALPFFVILAAIALDRLTTRVVGTELAGRLEAPLVLIAAGITFANLPTGAASFGTLAGGTQGAIDGKVWTVGDGSEVAAIAKSIDALGYSQLPLECHEVPRSYWQLLNQLGRLNTQVDPARSGAVALVRGLRPGAVATVTRDKAVIWSLTRRQ